MKPNIRVILIQAPADVSYALQIIAANKSLLVRVYVLNVYNVYMLLKYLKLENCDIFYIPYPVFNLKSYRTWIHTRNDLKRIWTEHFSQIIHRVKILHFFSRYEDPLCAYLVIKHIKLNKDIRIEYNNHYDPLHKEVSLLNSIRSFIKNIMMSIITGAKYDLEAYNKFPEFKVFSYDRINNVPLKYKSEVFDSWKYKANKDKTVLFLLNQLSDLKKSANICLQIINELCAEFKRRNYTIYVKGHPRIGLSEEFRLIADEEIESFILSEMIDYKTFDYVIGVDSTSIAHAALEKESSTYSIVDMIDLESINVIKEHLINQSNGKLKFVNNIKDVFE